MIFTSNKFGCELLENIPDFQNWQEALLWIKESQKQLRQLSLNKIMEQGVVSLEWDQREQNKMFPFGFYPSENWRKFVLAVFFADLISYERSTDQVDFERLLFVMHAFPSGFRTWWVKCDGWLPVGYTGWYPMSEAMFELFEKHPEKLKDRMVVPNVCLKENPYLYLFNFSIVPELKKSLLSKKLLKQFIADINTQNAAGLACIAVSDDGMRIAGGLGMSCSGQFHLYGVVEKVFVKSLKIG